MSLSLWEDYRMLPTFDFACTCTAGLDHDDSTVAVCQSRPLNIRFSILQDLINAIEHFKSTVYYIVDT